MVMANLLLDAGSSSPCRVKVTHSEFLHSSKYGIWLDNGSVTNSDIATSNHFVDNASGNIRTQN